jgi:hypothetical protein
VRGSPRGRESSGSSSLPSVLSLSCAPNLTTGLGCVRRRVPHACAFSFLFLCFPCLFAFLWYKFSSVMSLSCRVRLLLLVLRLWFVCGDIEIGEVVAEELEEEEDMKECLSNILVESSSCTGGEVLIFLCCFSVAGASSHMLVSVGSA